jgi:glycosyltransferase involved in cell wall biosynthesis
MRIGHLSLCYKPIIGGQEVYIALLNRILQINGHVCSVYQPFRRNIDGIDVVKIPIVPYLEYLIPHQKDIIFNLMLLLFYNKRLKENDIFIVHYASNYFPLRNCKNKTIIVSHGVDWYDKRNSPYDNMKRKIAKYTFDKYCIIANDTDYFRTLGLDVSPGRNYFTEIAPKKWFIPNCIDTKKFTKTKPIEEFRDRKIIIVPRQITPDRGIDLAIESFALLQKKYTQFKDYELIIIGSPIKGKYYDFCNRIVKENTIGNNVSFIGHVPHELMPNYYSSARLTIIPTIKREGTSLSALESMSCGTLTISTNVAGLLDLPTEQTSPNKNNLCELIAKSLMRREDIARKQSNIVRSVFRIENWEDAWLKVIDSLEKEL